MRALESFANTINEETGATGKELEEMVGIVGYLFSILAKNEEAREHFLKMYERNKSKSIIILKRKWYPVKGIMKFRGMLVCHQACWDDSMAQAERSRQEVIEKTNQILKEEMDEGAESGVHKTGAGISGDFNEDRQSKKDREGRS